MEDKAGERKERDAWKLLLKKSDALIELYDQAEKAVASDISSFGFQEVEADKMTAEGALRHGLEQAKGEMADVDAVKGVEKAVLRFARVME